MATFTWAGKLQLNRRMERRHGDQTQKCWTLDPGDGTAYDLFGELHEWLSRHSRTKIQQLTISASPLDNPNAEQFGVTGEFVFGMIGLGDRRANKDYLVIADQSLEEWLTLWWGRRIVLTLTDIAPPPIQIPTERVILWED
jgi:hypothetical protein